MNRNDIILKSVLKGYTLKQVGLIFNLSGTRVRQICNKSAYYHDKKLGRFAGIKELRKHKNRLIEIIKGGING